MKGLLPKLAKVFSGRGSFARRKSKGSDPIRIPIRELPKGLRFNQKAINRHAIGITTHLQKSGYESYLVGGCVRDLLVGRKPKDFDIGTVAWPRTAKNLIRYSRIIGRRFRLVHVPRDQEIFEVATFRRESTEEDRKKGRDFGENFYGTAEQDAWRRDFTVNALFYDPLKDEIVDYVGGLKDIQEGVIRSIGDPRVRFEEDPIRIIRAIRFSSIPQFRLGRGLESAIRQKAHLLEKANRSRLREEILKLMKFKGAQTNFRSCQEKQIFKYVFPELHERWDFTSLDHKKGAAARFMAALDEVSLSYRPVIGFLPLVFLARKVFLAEPEDRIPPYQELRDDESLTRFCLERFNLSHTERESIYRAIGLAEQMSLGIDGKSKDKILKNRYFVPAMIFFEMYGKVFSQHTDLINQWRKLGRTRKPHTEESPENGSKENGKENGFKKEPGFKPPKP